MTTAQIARAAGIDEATLLRVFDDRNALLTAAIQVHVMTALDPTQVVRDLQSIRLDQPLAARLAEAIDALDTYRPPRHLPRHARGRRRRRTPHPTVQRRP